MAIKKKSPPKPSPPKPAAPKPSILSKAVSAVKNTGSVLKASITGSSKIVANTPSPTLNRALEAVANNPFKTAAAATVIRYAAPIAKGAASLIRGGSAGSAAAAAAPAVVQGAARSSLMKYGIAAGAGAAGAFLLGKGQKQTQNQSQDPYQNTPVSVTPWNQPQQNPVVTPQQRGGVGITGNQNRVRFSQDQITNTSSWQNSPQTTITRNSPSQTAGQSAQAAQSSGTDFGMIALLLGAAYILSKR